MSLILHIIVPTVREQNEKVVYKFGEELKGQELVDSYENIEKTNPFDFVKSVSHTKKDIMVDDIVEIRHHS